MAHGHYVKPGGTFLNWNKDLLEGMEVILSARAPCPECPGDMLICIYVPLVKTKAGGEIRLSIIRQRKDQTKKKYYKIRTCCIDRKDCHGQQGVTKYKSVKAARGEYSNNQWAREPLRKS